MTGPEKNIQLSDLCKRYGGAGGAEAVRGLTLEVRRGETFGLLGPNGAGKTTTLSMLSTLVEPSGGDASIFGRSLLHEPREVRRLVGLAPQQISLYPDLSAVENLAFFGRLHGLRGSALRGRIKEMLDLSGLVARRRDLVRTYSGGMRRRLNLACALIHEPRLLLLDEPTAGVDPQSRENLFRAIRRINETGVTVIYTTHYMEEAERLCDRIAIMDEGRVAAVGSLAELLEIVGTGEVIEIRGSNGGEAPERLRTLPFVSGVEHDGITTRIFVKSAAHALGPIAGLLGEAGTEIESVEIYPVTLERVFMHLTGRALRD